jgi:hypothetical protein
MGFQYDNSKTRVVWKKEIRWLGSSIKTWQGAFTWGHVRPSALIITYPITHRRAKTHNHRSMGNFLSLDMIDLILKQKKDEGKEFMRLLQRETCLGNDNDLGNRTFRGALIQRLT